MSEIPEDVRVAAVGVKTLLRFTPVDEWGAAIARAIFAERKRCADVARLEASNIVDNDPSERGVGYSFGYRHACNNAASAIESGA